MAAELLKGDHRKACCREPENLALVRVSGRRDLTIHICAVCMCRHFELEVDTGHYQIRQHAIH